jgi:hypothetical protein
VGKLSGCDNAALANQPFKIAIQGDGSSSGFPGVTDATGNYTVSGMLCNVNNSAVTVQAMAYIDAEFRYAPAIILDPVTGSYNAQLCDTSSSVDDNFEIVFPDPGLDSIIRAAINKPSGAIFYKDVKIIDRIDGHNLVNDLSGIQFCTNLKEFNFHPGANLTDLGLLRNLLSLERLYIEEIGPGGLTDITPLKSLPQLTSLTLRCPKLSDISTLQNLVQLQYMTLFSNSISDISVLGNLTQLISLQLTTPAIGGWSELASLTKLKSLDLTIAGMTTTIMLTTIIMT